MSIFKTSNMLYVGIFMTRCNINMCTSDEVAEPNC